MIFERIDEIDNMPLREKILKDIKGEIIIKEEEKDDEELRRKMLEDIKEGKLKFSA